MLLSLKSLLPRSEFGRNVITLMTGTAIAQAIPISVTPILTRIYTPEDFGVFAMFIAITSILGSVVNGRYELAIMLPVKDEDAINIAALGLLIATVFSLLLLIPTIFFNRYIVDLVGNPAIGYWLYFVPFVVLMAGLYNILNYLNTRKKLFGDIAKANVYKSIGMTSVQLGIGFIKSGAGGLISGQIISFIISNCWLAITAKQKYDTTVVGKLEIIRLAKKYKDFPQFSMCAILSNTLAYNLSNILISIYYSVSTLGFYSLAQRALLVPTSLIGRSIAQVYFQQAMIEKQKTGKAIHSFNSASKKLFVLSIITFVPIYFILQPVFEFVFGKEWRIAGEYAQITLPFVAIQFIAAALSNTNNIFEKQKIELILQIGLFVLSIGIIFSLNILEYEFIDLLKILSCSLFFYYGLLYLILWAVSRGRL